MATCDGRHPLVLRCNPVYRERDRLLPFPTLYWLACPDLHRQIAEQERYGLVLRVQRAIQADPALLRGVQEDHRTYIRERHDLLTPADRFEAGHSGILDALLTRGIGGLRDFSTIKCLHLHYAHHLARGSTIGRWMDERGLLAPCGAGAERASQAASRA